MARHGLCARARSKNSRAFTLLELIAVVFIVTTMIAIAVPTFSKGLQKNSVRTQARQLAALLRYAHDRAALARVGYELRIDEAAGEYTLTRADDQSSTTEVTEGSGGETWNLPPGIRFEEVSISALPELSWDQSAKADVAVLKFRPLGTTDGARIVLADRKNRRLVISVEAVTGAVEVTQDEK